MSGLREITVPITKPATEWVNGRALQKVSPQEKHARAHVGNSPITVADPLGLRPPTSAEVQFISQYFGTCINPQKLDIIVRRIGDTSRALSLNGGFMSFPREDFVGGDANKGLNLADPRVAGELGHETLHQLQWLNGINVTAQAIFASIAVWARDL